MFVLHILSAIVAFGPLFVFPPLARSADSKALANVYLRIVLPALVLTWVFGMGLQGMSSGAYTFGQVWLIASLLIWVALVAVGWFFIKPALDSSDAAARAKLSMGIGMTHLGMLVTLILMVWKPGVTGG